MLSFEEKLDVYAELIVKIGVNVQKRQNVHISVSTEAAPLARLITKHAYGVGAKHVHIDWLDDEVSKIKYMYAPDEAFLEFPSWKVAERDAVVEEGAAFVSITSANPDLLKGVDPIRIANYQKTASKAVHNFQKGMLHNTFPWTIVAYAGEEWANTVFPNSEDSVTQLWEAIFASVRVSVDNPYEQWQKHTESLLNKTAYLNAKKYRALYYSAPGTDLKIELSDQHLWRCAGTKDRKGIPFVPNMPTEEVFTSPKKSGVSGTVTSTKPLSYGGSLIDRFSLSFENGRIVEVKAEKGEDVLKNLIATDEGSHYLGEVALVPHESPISSSNILFSNTLFDENASNHLAIGFGFPFCIESGGNMNEEELNRVELNKSITHVDFMIGSAEMNIDGELADGTREAIFRKGNWAF